jgi:uncharacterized phage infection (PIP) family protein YhgE
VSVQQLTGLIIALSGVLGTYVAWRLGQRGQRNDEKQQAAATSLQERIAAFDELESLNDRLTTENTRLRELVTEAETRGDLRLAQQAGRCRERITEMTTAISTLQSVVLSEVARASAQEANERAQKHLDADHPET